MTAAGYTRRFWESGRTSDAFAAVYLGGREAHWGMIHSAAYAVRTVWLIGYDWVRGKSR
jgi:hypothetical protein